MLPRRKQVAAKQDSRWRSPAHCAWVRGFACCMCGSTTNTAAAHVRIGSHTGLGQKPDDWRTAPLCDGLHSAAGEMLGCHNRQHIIGEATFWRQYEAENGQSVEQLLDELCKASPKAGDIRRVKAERADG